MANYADPTCPTCIAWDDGDPACPAHGGTYQQGMACPGTGDADHIVVVWQYGAAYACLTCEAIAELPQGGEGAALKINLERAAPAAPTAAGGPRPRRVHRGARRAAGGVPRVRGGERNAAEGPGAPRGQMTAGQSASDRCQKLGKA
jgi:hypothetical protein